MKNYVHISISILFCFVAVFAPRADTQFVLDAALSWQVIETDHFIVYYPLEMEQWTANIASKMEKIYDKTIEFVGFSLDEKIKVIIDDPYNTPNGMALPLIKKPRILLWSTAPDTPLMLGNFYNWGELVFSHELGHIVHLTIPARNWREQFLSWLLPIGPVSMKSPLWLAEGYAVMMEEKFTGSGRPSSAIRASFLRQLAVEGKFPSYEELTYCDKWYGGMLPYFIGSSFMEWLETEVSVDDVWNKLWRRMSSKHARSFDEAFQGLFQDQPEDMYHRYTAEMTYEALKLERAFDELGIIEGDHWQAIKGFVGHPQISPNGKKMALTIHTKTKPPMLKVISMVETKEKKEKMIVDHPYDIPDKPYHPPERKILATLKAGNGINPKGPRWLHNGESLVFHSLSILSNGYMKNDLFQWFPGDNHVERITYGESIKWPDPFPDDSVVAAIQQKNGLNSVVLVDIKSGEYKQLTNPTLDTIWGQPRVAPNGKEIAVSFTSASGAGIALINTSNGDRNDVNPEKFNEIMMPEWDSNCEGLYVVTDRNGSLNIEYWSRETNTFSTITNSHHTHLMPIPDPGAENKVLYYIDFRSDGFQLFRIKPSPHLTHSMNAQFTGYPLLPPENRKKPIDNSLREFPTAHPVGITHLQDYGFAFSGAHLPQGHSVEAGFRGGDLLGRLEYLFLGGYGWEGLPSGSILGIKYRGWPLKISADIFWNQIDLNDQKNIDSEVNELDYESYGIDLHGRYKQNHRFVDVGIGANCSWSHIHSTGWTKFDRFQGSVNTEISGRYCKGFWGTSAAIEGRQTFGRTNEKNWYQSRLTATLQCSYRLTHLRVTHVYGQTSGEPNLQDLFSIGGWTSSIQPRSYRFHQKDVPYLPAYTFFGDDLEWTRVEFILGSMVALHLYGDRLNFNDDDYLFDPFYAAGVEICGKIPSIPFGSVTSTRIKLGFSRMFDEPFTDEWKAYAAISIRP